MSLFLHVMHLITCRFLRGGVVMTPCAGSA